MNKEQLEKLSDKEISLLIANMPLNVDLSIEFNMVMRSAEIRAVEHGRVDYCSNWSDIGPLIAKMRVNVSYENDGGGDYMYVGQHHFEGDNILRAYAIVYLLITSTEEITMKKQTYKEALVQHAAENVTEWVKDFVIVGVSENGLCMWVESHSPENSVSMIEWQEALINS